MQAHFLCRKHSEFSSRSYAAATAELAVVIPDKFSWKWDKDYPAFSVSLRNNWAQIIPLFGYPPAICKTIYTTNAIELRNLSLWKVTKTRWHFLTINLL
ncbi:hypothetical protein C4544_03845 [candidate division WS5 bacterium]|uniref:Mutator family transposase n=1 Tax=candidate division WS5 bacterium TaxID=2093353 RepID=A0A419DD69_9BACT|nr:MAG: hypothetical protein C4544_03845 [candidate division WS5 bacterium]